MASVCPECGSTKFTKAGYTVVERKKLQRYRCSKCLRTFTYLHHTGKKKEKQEEADES